MKCMCNTTDEELAAWGFPVRITTKSCGSEHIVRPGMRRDDALAAARKAGKIGLLCTHDVPAPPVKSTTVDPAMLDFFMSIKATPSRAVPADVSVKANRVGNIDTDRLLRRRVALVDMVTTPGLIDKRSDFMHRARELFAIENELESRNMPFNRKTLPNV